MIGFLALCYYERLQNRAQDPVTALIWHATN